MAVIFPVFFPFNRNYDTAVSRFFILFDICFGLFHVCVFAKWLSS